MSKNKLILSLSSLVFFNLIGLATVFAQSKENNFYLKTAFSISKVSDIKVIEPGFNLKHHSAFSPAIGIGFGYYLNDNARIDLMFEHLRFDFKKQSSSFEDNSENTFTTGTKYVERITYGKSLILNGYMDIIDKKTYKIFIGAGAGAVRLKETIYNSLSGNTITSDQICSFPLITEPPTSKVSTNFTHSFMLGTSININPQLNIELIYSWKNFGKVRNNKYQGHHFSIATRFDL